MARSAPMEEAATRASLVHPLPVQEGLDLPYFVLFAGIPLPGQ